ncbi:MAG: calcium/sodium antiporter [Myxococcota bacterium]|jgi:cation:H+ antiporter|nr:calcium/sodium antiporter [Myxococcota bacterium]
MLINILQTAAGLVILLVGGDLMVRGASSLARNMGISPLAVGLTVVAFGTSAPELAVSIGSAINGSSELAFGNIYGSNLANIGLIIGLSAVIRPLPIDGVVTRRELPMMLLAVVSATVMACDSLLDGGTAQYARADGFVFLLFFVVFIFYTVGDLIAQRDERINGDGEAIAPLSPVIDHPIENDVVSPPGAKGPRFLRDLGEVVIGLAGLLLGAELTVSGSVEIARAMGVPEVIVGLTMVSVGTSLPELVATLSAVRRGELAIAVGGVVGSNIFNILLVCGLTSVVMPIPIPKNGLVDLLFTVVLSLVLMLTARTHSRLILRWEGAGLLVSYLVYMSWRAL